MSYPKYGFALQQEELPKLTRYSRSVESMPASHHWVGISLLGDLAVLGAALAASFWLRFRSGWMPISATDPFTLEDYSGLMLIGATLLILSFNSRRLYSERNLLRY